MEAISALVLAGVCCLVPLFAVSARSCSSSCFAAAVPAVMSAKAVLPAAACPAAVTTAGAARAAAAIAAAAMTMAISRAIVKTRGIPRQETRR